jgi:hypothetical protein
MESQLQSLQRFCQEEACTAQKLQSIFHIILDKSLFVRMITIKSSF